MIFSTLLRPPGAPPDEETRPVSYPERGVVPETRQRARRYRRAVSLGVIVSVVVHLILVLLSSVLIRYVEAPGFLPPVQPVGTAPEGMRVVNVQVTEAPEVEPVSEPPAEPRPEQPATPAAAGEELGPLPPAALRLRPRVGDWRLWVVPVITRRTDRTAEEQAAEVRARLHAELAAANDSIAAALALEASRLDWTVGEEGNKWGVTPGKLHLGPVTLPLPIFLEPGGDWQEQLDEYNAIQQQGDRAVIDETLEDRIKAIRERRAREQADKKAQQDTSSSGGSAL